MTEVESLTGFDHGGGRARGDRFEVSEQVAKALERKGLVKILKAVEADPSQAVGAKLSASPAVQASPQTTANESKVGAKKRRKTAA